MSTPLRERPDAPLGTLIFRAGLLPAETIESALEEGVKTGKRLGEILTERGLISEVDLARLLAGQKGLDFVILREQIVDPAAAALFTEEQARLFRALPYALEGELPVVAIADPTDDVLMRNIREALGRDDARFVVSARGELAEISADVYSKPLTPAPAPAPAPPTEPEPDLAAHGEHTNGNHTADAEQILQAYEPPVEPVAREPEPVAHEPEPVAHEPEPVAHEPEPELEPEPEPELEPEPAPEAPEAPTFQVATVEQPAVPEPVQAPTPEPEPEPVASYEPEPVFVEEPIAAPAAPPAPEPEPPAAHEPPAQAEPVVAPEPFVPEPAATPEPVLHVEQPVAPLPPAPAAPEAPAPAPEPEALEPVPFPQPDPAPPAPPYPPAAEAPEAPAETSPPLEVEVPVAAPVAQAADAVTWHLTIRLTNGEHVEAGDFTDLESAKDEAKAVMTQVADADSGDWPFVNGRFLKPDTIVSVDITESSGDEA